MTKMKEDNTPILIILAAILVNVIGLIGMIIIALN